jgi:hypothetical protein
MIIKKFPTKVILVGCGSIGKRYLLEILNQSIECIVVDPKNNLLVDYDLSSKAGTIHVKSLKDIPKYFIDVDTTVIIANWGPDHFDVFIHFMKLGLQRFIIEKPIVSKLKDLNELEKLVLKNKLMVVINQGWSAVYLSDRILKLATQFSLGDLQSLNVNGGARCMSTAGSHYIHLASKLLKSDFFRLASTLNNKKINPRASHLSFFDGNLAIEYFNEKYFSMQFSNNSSVQGSILLYWAEAVGELIDQNLTIKMLNPRRDFRDIVTRYAHPEIILSDGIVSFFEFDAANEFKNLLSYSTLDYSQTVVEFQNHIQSNRILLYGLIANKLNKNLFYNSSIPMKFKLMDFKIS